MKITRIQTISMNKDKSKMMAVIHTDQGTFTRHLTKQVTKQGIDWVGVAIGNITHFKNPASEKCNASIIKTEIRTREVMKLELVDGKMKKVKRIEQYIHEYVPMVNYSQISELS
jgi:hypothetical protein